MCIVFLSLNRSPSENGYYIILAANRDELYSRPSMPAEPLHEAPDVICGIDLQPDKPGGTWIGVSRKGRIAAITNGAKAAVDNTLQSRGVLVKDFLTGDASPTSYLEEIAQHGDKFNAFFLLTIALRENMIEGCVFSNLDGKGIQNIPDGLHGLSNTAFNANERKTTYGKELFENATMNSTSKDDLIDNLLTLLKDEKKHPEDPMFPDELAAFSSIKVGVPNFGTQTHTIILVDNKRRATFVEHTMESPITKDIKWIKTRHDFDLQ